jgi:hypothetical protein
MNKTSIVILIAFICLPHALINAQLKNESLDKDQLLFNSYPGENADSGNNVLKNNIKTKKLSTSMEVGTSFMFSPKYYYGPSFFISPGLNYNVSPRFNLQAGLIVERSTLYPLREMSPYMANGQVFINTSMYARASYLLTPHLKLQGTVFQTINDVPKQMKNSSPMNYNSKGAIIGLDYKINNSLSIGFDVRMQNNSYNSLNQGYYYPAFGY